MPLSISQLVLSVGARNSPLSKAQVQEIIEQFKRNHIDLLFECSFVDTSGDLDLQTSLRTMDKTDFFTKEIDQRQLKGEFRIAIHSAKDLPDPMTSGLRVIALTEGIDSADVLVMRSGESFERLPFGAVIATSSLRREDVVKQLRPDLRFIDLRGKIGDRLAFLDSGEADGVVLAEAALIRLGLTHLNRIRLPGETAPFQGQLAVVAREADVEAALLFHWLDVRR